MSPLSSSAPRLLGPSALALLVAALCPQESAGYLSSSAPQLFSSSAPQMLSSAARQPLRSSVLTLSSAAPQPSSSSAHQPFSRRTALAFTLVTAGFGAKEVLAEEAKEDFYTKWPFEKPSDVLPFVFANARKGHPEEILSALDEFGKYYPNYRLGSEKGDILESKLKEINPKNCLEIGTFWGYSAIRTARNLPEGGKLTCIEYNGNHANVARQLISYAGFSDKVELVLGKSSYMLPKVAKKIGQADYVLMDHIKPLYLPDLQLMEKLGVVGEGTVVIADNVVYPGAPDFLDYVETGKGSYQTELIEADFEYNLDSVDPRGSFRGEKNHRWAKGAIPKRDALSLSYRLSPRNSQILTATAK